MKKFRVTGSTLKVLAAFIEAHPQPLAGSDIMNAKKVLSGTLYPLLDRLDRSGVLENEWEDIDPAKEGRPRRRLYSLTADGYSRACRVLEEHGVGFPSYGHKNGEVGWAL